MNKFKERLMDLLFILILSVFLISGCGGGEWTGHWLPQGRLASISVTPATVSIPMGAPQQFMATATYTDGTSRDVTAFSIWTSGATGVATVNSTSGLATGIAIGTSVIAANFDGSSGSATLTVTAATLSSIAVMPATATVQIGFTQRFVATGTFTDGTTVDISNIVTWSSDTIAVATVVSPGVTTGLSVGTALITATSGGKSGSATLTVTAATLSSIAVTPATATVQIGLTQRFVATGTFTDGTTVDISNIVTWSSSALTVATVVSLGVATGVSAGTATITAILGGKSGLATLTVTAATLSSIAVTPATATVQIGLTQPFVATGTYSDGTTLNITNTVEWRSGNTPVATVLLSTGVATGVSAGTATITATLGGKSGSATLTVTAATLSSIAVTPATATVQIGLTQPFVATGTYSDGTTLNITNTVEWRSGNTPVATVLLSTGVATGVSAGTATITATLGGKSGSATLTVPAATLSSIAVTPATATVPIGFTQPFVAIGTYSDGTSLNITNTVEWRSGNTPVATVLLSTGVATGVSAGTATITATLGGKSGSATLTVPAATLSSIAVTPATATVPMGLTQTFVAMGTYSDGTSVNISTTIAWTSGSPLVATVMSPGVATGESIGTATITATLGGKSGSATLTVTAATLSSIAVTPLTASVPMGLTQTFIAMGTYSDGTSVNISATVAWTSGSPLVATVISPGVATGESVGIATITAALGGKSGSATLTVTAATLSSIALTPATATVPIGFTQPFVARGTYSDGTSVDISSTVTWRSGTIAVATVMSTGVATGVSAGTATITATLGGKSGSATLTVSPELVNLGSASHYGGFGGDAGMTNQGTLTVINNGDIGTTGVSTMVTGFHDSTGDKYIETPLNIGDVKGRVYTAPPPPVIFGPGGPFGGTAETTVIADAAAADTLTAFNYLAGLPGGAFAGAGELGGLTLTAGTYTSSSSFKITTGDLTLTGGANDIWVFQMGSSLTVGAPGFPRNVILAGGALAENVFWQVGSAARIEDKCNMVGTIISYSGVTISTAGQSGLTTLDGRALATNASVTMVNTIINVPAH